MECLLSIYKLLCCIRDPVFPVPYNFQFGSPQNIINNKLLFESNFVRTSKYHWYDFLPSNSLVKQNLYYFSSNASPIFTFSS